MQASQLFNQEEQAIASEQGGIQEILSELQQTRRA